MGKQQKIAFGEYRSVLLTEKEYAAVLARCDGNQQLCDEAIRQVDLYKCGTSRKYKSDYFALLRWGIEAARERLTRRSRYQPATGGTNLAL